MGGTVPGFVISTASGHFTPCNFDPYNMDSLQFQPITNSTPYSSIALQFQPVAIQPHLMILCKLCSIFTAKLANYDNWSIHVIWQVLVVVLYTKYNTTF